MITIEQIRERLIAAIKTCGMTQTEICRKLEISAATVSQYISGRAMPALDTFANLCVIIDADPAEILGTGEVN